MARYDTHWQSKGKKRRATQVRWGKLLLAPAILAGVTLVAWAVVRSPLFAVERVTVAGASHVDTQAVIDAARSAPAGWLTRAITRANVLGWPSGVPSTSVAFVPGAQRISISRSLFSGTVALTVTEREPIGVWCFEKSGSPVCQWFDQDGVVYGRAYVSEGSLVPVVHDGSQEKAGDGRRVLPGDQLQNFLAIVSVLKARGVSPKEMQVAVAGGKQELSMTTYNGPRLLFTLRAAPDQVPAVLDDFMKRGELGALQYIDFRSPKRAFYL